MGTCPLSLYLSSYGRITYIHCRTIDKVDATMNKVNEQRELANDIAEAISNPMNSGIDLDDVSFSFRSRLLHHSCDFFLQDELKAELEALEQDDLNERLMGAEHVPVHNPAGPSRMEECEYRCRPIHCRHLIISNHSTEGGGRRRRSAVTGVDCVDDNVTFRLLLFYYFSNPPFTTVLSINPICA